MSGEFGDLEAEMIALYERRDYAAALSVVDRIDASEGEVGHRTKVAFYRACLLARLGDPVRALRALETGIEAGLWWSDRMLADADLDPCRGSRLDAILAASRQGAADPGPRCLISGSHDVTAPLLLALHGGGEVVTNGDNRWRAAELAGWRVARPVSTQEMGAGLATWTDLDRGVRECRAHLTTLGSPRAIGSFSLGGSLAVMLASAGLTAPLLLVAPTLQPRARPDVTGALMPPIHIVTGAADPQVNTTRSFVAQWRAAGADVELEVRDGIGHVFPPDFDVWLSARLAPLVA